VVVWPGLGGHYTTIVGQAGTSYNFAGYAAHQAWSEVAPAPPISYQFYGHPGWGFEAHVTWTGNGYQLFLKDDYTNTAITPFMPSSQYDGSTAEAIVERPLSGYVPPLKNFFYLDFKWVYVKAVGYGSDWVPLSNFFPYSIAMKSNQTQDILAAPGSYASNGGFRDNYMNCG
jgi:hypothetical protein